ncbi:Hpt domain-containing protein [Thiomicrorhabdus xiamenensis]|uniref:Hpt domain-containing protein n=1 Tax=Thiomicrorhabdus xiamenensis TaxID=2739063 RepID=A0A7D4SZL1_9GAMM|nr:Hpt domain-containing protein [Thiomicrorhabdus xiamenensis]QKI88265.1 Hpt domain-containing protein [Thiomicrorhabdus xiamenensis]
MSVDEANLHMLKEVIGDDLKEIIDAFLTTSPEILGQVKLSIEIKDAAGVQLHSHTLKGSSANIGATKLPALCAELESKAKEGVVTDDFNRMYQQIETEMQNVFRHLKQFLQSF